MIDEGGPGGLAQEQRALIAQRLAFRASDGDSGEALAGMAAALEISEAVEQLEAVVAALGDERVIVPIIVEADPRQTGEHPGGVSEADFSRADVEGVGPALAVFSSALALRLWRSDARPMGIQIRRVALSALVETGGRVVVDPGVSDIVLPRPAVSALAQGDSWLPAWRDTELLDDLRQAVGLLPGGHSGAVIGVRVVFGGGVETIVELVAAHRGDERAVRTDVARAIQAVTGNERLAGAVDRLQIRPVWAAPA